MPMFFFFFFPTNAKGIYKSQNTKILYKKMFWLCNNTTIALELL